ncbi:hypothetical protein K525DRAFT_273181 [Schizophyllum commune Loenen D]|nr:hypothetical protein K525DRAFT_273181 [Schizophyllum commune Loenen D]
MHRTAPPPRRERARRPARAARLERHKELSTPQARALDARIRGLFSRELKGRSVLPPLAKDAIAAVKKRVQTKLKQQLESLMREKWRELVESRELFRLLNAFVPIGEDRFFYEEGEEEQDAGEGAGMDDEETRKRPQLSESSDDDEKESIVATDVTPPMQPSQRTMDREYIYISSDESDAEDAPSSRSMNSSSPIGRHHAVDHRAPSPPEDEEEEEMVERSLALEADAMTPSPVLPPRTLSPAGSPVSWSSLSPAPASPLALDRPSPAPLLRSQPDLKEVLEPSDDEIEFLGTGMSISSTSKAPVVKEEVPIVKKESSGAASAAKPSGARRDVRRLSNIGNTSRLPKTRSDPRRTSMPDPRATSMASGSKRKEATREPPPRVQAPPALEDSDSEIECIGYNPAPPSASRPVKRESTQVSTRREGTQVPPRRKGSERALLAKVEQDINNLLG